MAMQAGAGSLPRPGQWSVTAGACSRVRKGYYTHRYPLCDLVSVVTGVAREGRFEDIDSFID